MKKKDYTTIAAHVPLGVAKAVKDAALAAGNRSVSEFLGEMVARQVLPEKSSASVEAEISARAGVDEEIGAAAGRRSA